MEHSFLDRLIEINKPFENVVPFSRVGMYRMEINMTQIFHSSFRLSSFGFHSDVCQICTPSEITVGVNRTRSSLTEIPN